jgi:hypothetical protein
MMISSAGSPVVGKPAVQPGPMCRSSGDSKAAILLHGQAERRRSVSSGVSSMTAQ